MLYTSTVLAESSLSLSLCEGEQAKTYCSWIKVGREASEWEDIEISVMEKQQASGEKRLREFLLLRYL